MTTTTTNGYDPKARQLRERVAALLEAARPALVSSRYPAALRVAIEREAARVPDFDVGDVAGFCRHVESTLAECVEAMGGPSCGDAFAG